MSNIYYRDDLRGYDDLLTFTDMYPTFSEFKKLNDYMFNATIQDEDEKLYNLMFMKWKNNFFRWSTVASITLEMSKMMEAFLIEVKTRNEIAEDLLNLTNTTTINTSYKTDNSTEDDDDESILNYRTSEDKTITDDGLTYADRKIGGLEYSTLAQDLIQNMKTMFMNHTNEVVVKSVYTKK